MKNLLIVMLVLSLGTVAFGQEYRSKLGGEKVRPVSTPPPVSQRANFEGALPRAVNGGNPLQMVNPKAPAKYGTAAQSVILDPDTGKWKGIKLFEIFW